jgi:hypothetical protein
MVTFELEGVQGAFDIVHSKILFPKPNPVIVVLGNKEFVIIPEPETKLHAPVPTAGKFPLSIVVGEEMQRVWLEPAFEIEGI